LKALSSPKLKSLWPLICGYLGYILWGFSYHFICIAQESAPSTVLLSHRFVVSLILMTVLIAARVVKVSFKNKVWGIMILQVIVQFAYYLFESATTKAINGSMTSAVSAVSPVISIILAAIFLKEYPTVRQRIFCVLPVVGVILMTMAGKDLGIINATSIFLLVMAIFTSGAYRTINRSAAKHFTSFERTFILFVFSAIANTLVAMNEVDWSVAAYLEPLKTPSYLGSMLFLAVICSLVCNLLVNYATGNLPVVKISSLGALITVVGVLVGLCTGDPWNPMFLVAPCSSSWASGKLRKSPKKNKASLV